jgi:hypothetical protein
MNEILDFVRQQQNVSLYIPLLSFVLSTSDFPTDCLTKFLLVEVPPVSPEGSLLSLAASRSGKNVIESTMQTVCEYLSHPRPSLFCAGLRMLHQWVTPDVHDSRVKLLLK